MPEKDRVVTLGCETNMPELKDTASWKTLSVSVCLTRRYKFERMHTMPEIDGIVDTGDFHKINAINHEALHITGCHAEIGALRKVRITHAFAYDLSGVGVA